MKAQEIRKSYLEFFQQRGHIIKPSDGLIPASDPTLLFTSAGMVQFKPLWTDAPLEFNRATSVQKCLRVGGKQSDLENVGKTLRHHTFFEMLGNFSFGDYFKKEAIDWAWEFVIDVMQLEKENLWVSIFKDDDEAFELWQARTGIAKEKIVRLGEKDNFWGPAGNEGPCGPCSEIYFDRGREWGCGSPDCRPGCDCERYIEFWNLVFPQYYQESEGTRRILARKGIDTGMGLERLALLAQGAPSNYGTDLFAPIIKEIETISEQPYRDDFQSSYHAIADHARALTFTIAENILPSNEGRGYIVRRLLRRASRFGRKLGLDQPFLYRLIPTVTSIMKEAYPELLESREHVSRIVKAEEERFGQTLKTGLQLLEEISQKVKSSGETLLSGQDVFMLSDTYGFPPELTEEVAQEQGLGIDWPEFKNQLNQQRKRGRQAWKGMAESEILPVYHQLNESLDPVEFIGYDQLSCQAELVGIIQDDEVIAQAKAGKQVGLVLDKTVFYAEAGGQVGDIGFIQTPSGKAEVLNTISPLEGLVIQQARIISGELKTGQEVEALVDQDRRWHIQRHHSTTHLLQHALREVLGDHISQAGSFVGPDYFRFDFTHFEGLTPEQIEKVTRRVNEMIRQDDEVKISRLPLAEAKKAGALAFFGEKYGDTVRIVDIGGYSREFCGGCHVSRSGQIGLFLILSDSSSAAGVRRIEAICGEKAMEHILRERQILSGICEWLKVTPDQIVSRFEKINGKVKELEKEKESLIKQQVQTDISALINQTRKIAGVTVLTANLGSLDMKSLRALADDIKTRLGSGIAILGSASREKAFLVAAVTPDLIKQGWKAGDIIRECARMVGGSGGGRPDLAQAGGKKPNNLKDALAATDKIIKNLKTSIKS